MRAEELLDKREKAKIELLRYLILNENVSLSQLSHHLKLSINTLKLYMRELSELKISAGEQIKITSDEGILRLYLPSGLNLDRVIAYYLKDSLEFNLLRKLLLRRKISILYLSQKFSISESSVFRRIKRVNHLLEEFGLSIKNGILQGEELQIRYFYFLVLEYMYQNSTSFSEKYFPGARSRQVARSFLTSLLVEETSLDLEDRLLIWLEISRLRSRQVGARELRVKRRYQIFQMDKLYQDIKAFTESYVKNFNYKNLDFESLALYAFVNSLGILNESRQYSYELLRSKRLPTAMLDVYIREYILKNYPSKRISLDLEKQVGFYLAKSSNRLYFFDGSLERYDWDNLLKRQGELINGDLFHLASNLQEIALKEFEPYKDREASMGVKNYLLVSYINILSFIDFHVSELIRIGVDQRSLPIFGLNYSQYLYKNLGSSQEGISIVSYDPAEDYDLVITCRQLLKVKARCRLYRLSEYESYYDLKQIERIVEEIKLNKNSRRCL
ncbi:helix-turn-helix domain-containing protein [Streptococcaceae bacterium ESL0687]|nr:helix-turn-helix domain-containing protein [Streptococcaceae bacterium ESL0687]